MQRSSPGIYIGKVDCAMQHGQTLCEKYHATGNPDIKFGHWSILDDYEGKFSLSELQTFVKRLKPQCNAFRLDLCSEEEVFVYETLMLRQASDILKAINGQHKLVYKARVEFREEVKRLQGLYELALQTKKDALKTVKHGPEGLHALLSVQAKRGL
jgi:hypothetical protein